MARTRPTPTATVPGAGTLFALRAIGLVILARWLHSMAQMNFVAALEGMASSPAASLNLVFLFLLIVLPGARARVERPFHPLPQWLRQALRFFGVLGFLFAIGSIGVFVWTAGWRRTFHAVADTNGWLVAAPALYAAVVWICRPRALWRSNFAARRFAIGRFAVSIDAATRTTVVWQESRKVGQYDARELSVRWLTGALQGGAVASRPALLPAPAQPGHPAPAGVAEPVAAVDCADSSAALGAGQSAATPEPGAPASPRPASASSAAAPAGKPARRAKIELLWDSPAAAGHNRQTVFRVGLGSEGDRTAARALDAALKQV
ncbi:hypothetical protein [Paraburkholderia silvatlantica]|uniref:PH (Pleckstrin Homology) domain-containing protein n=1 Tax=Paraburkholderia silvatlantica TaxID=321895 RepID=A0ABR6FR97_9BURK|nr:hypothetical protein [Paraburkholderia silvatlantica]MBB2929952.1 hypothetical protein [Paraburkholderia silvatlantica]PVY29637.1 hypothetical protein C7411_11470 [Paraburkholderia silvatlantica]PXW31479.1 hypothetical protein C7413_12518 [Paraburkholderia silvatlantica]